jgi:predicted nucleotidyltransferase
LEIIKATIEELRKRLIGKFQDNLKCLILYGSWTKGTASEYSDIDLLAIFEKVNGELRKSVWDITSDMSTERSITLVTSTVEDFTKEKLPLYTAVKKEGKIIWGNVDLTISQEKPDIKYAQAFKKSKEFETQKVITAEEMLKKHPSYGTAELCYIAAKHAIQMALAMKGIGYSSKVSVLLPLAKEHLGNEVSEKFRKLFELYIKSEYGVEFLTNEESKLAIEYAKEILKVYER